VSQEKSFRHAHIHVMEYGGSSERGNEMEWFAGTLLEAPLQ